MDACIESCLEESLGITCPVLLGGSKADTGKIRVENFGLTNISRMNYGIKNDVLVE